MRWKYLQLHFTFSVLIAAEFFFYESFDDFYRIPTRKKPSIGCPLMCNLQPLSNQSNTYIQIQSSILKWCIILSLLVVTTLQLLGHTMAQLFRFSLVNNKSTIKMSLLAIFADYKCAVYWQRSSRGLVSITPHQWLKTVVQQPVSCGLFLLYGSTLACVSLRRPGCPPAHLSEPGCPPSPWRRWRRLHLGLEPFVFGRNKAGKNTWREMWYSIFQINLQNGGKRCLSAPSKTPTFGKWPSRELRRVGWLDTPAGLCLTFPPLIAPLAPPY